MAGNQSDVIVTVTTGGLFDMTDTVYFHQDPDIPSALVTTFVSSSILTAIIPFALLNTIGIAEIFVRD